MNIFVCVKPVPDTESKIQLKEDRSGIQEDSIKWIVNPYDEYAIEESIKLKASLSCEKVYVVSLGPKKRVTDSCRVALAMGCDEAVIVETEEALDSLATAKAIQAAIAKTEGEAALVLTGKSSIDFNSASFTQQLASLMGVAHLNAVSKIEKSDEGLKVSVEQGAGTRAHYLIKGLCVLGATKGLNTPRYPSLPGIMKAKKKPVTSYSLEDLSCSNKSSLKYTNYQLPESKGETQILNGELESQVAELVDILKNKEKVL